MSPLFMPVIVDMRWTAMAGHGTARGTARLGRAGGRPAAEWSRRGLARHFARNTITLLFRSRITVPDLSLLWRWLFLLFFGRTTRRGEARQGKGRDVKWCLSPAGLCAALGPGSAICFHVVMPACLLACRPVVVTHSCVIVTLPCESRQGGLEPEG